MRDFLFYLIANVLTTAVLMAAIGFLGKSLIENWITKNIEDYKLKLRKIEINYQLDQERIFELDKIMKKYSGVVLIAASDLQDRLWHLCERQAISKNPVLLLEDNKKPAYSSWPMTQDHYLSSTIYLFARYFCWIEILKSKVQFLNFGDSDKTNAFMFYLKKIERALAETDLQKLAEYNVSFDRPIFQLLQVDAGELMMQEGQSEGACISFHVFSQSFEKMYDSSVGLQSLKDLIMGAMSKNKSYFHIIRLKLVANALVDLIHFLNKELGLVSSEAILKIEVKQFDNEEYNKLWGPK